ncbi:MAG TPA: EamA family transporter, partial [Candidatus Pseudogracilibacillus intestinigallinarum]|nr:EamA family transporter [Candidatus Pseudogracilibacillus intestinigallinarum]
MTRIYILLALIMLIWGFNLSALAVLVKNVEPITLTSFRIFIAGISVLIITKIMGLFRFPTKNEWKTIAII